MSTHALLERSLFESALELPASERATFVERAAAGDSHLRDAVLELLRFHDEGGETRDDLPEVDAFLDEFEAQLPEQLGPFRILGRLGRGGMGVVYRAAREGEPECALKVLRAGSVSRQLLGRFQREGEVLARVLHPGIARFFEAGVLETANTAEGTRPSVDPRPYLAMELVEGPSLRIWAAGEHSLDHRLQLLAHVADAVQSAHAQGIVHRDLKPENIIVRADGSPCVLDFGVARLTDSDVRATTMMTTMGAIVGTIRYMSPEQADPAKGEITPRADVYALALVAWELLNGSMPYEVPQDSVHRALVAVLMAEPRTLDQVRDRRRDALEQLLRRALSKSQAERHADAGEFAEDLRRVARGERPAVSGSFRLRRGPAPWIAALGLAVVATWLVVRPHEAALMPAEVLRASEAHIDSATGLIQWNDRSVSSMQSALTHARAAENLLKRTPRQAWHDDILLGSLVQQAEAHGVLAEFTRDPAHLDSSVALCDRIDALKIPFDSPVSMPDSTSRVAARIRDYRRHIPGWRQAGALFDLADYRDPHRNLSRAIAFSDSAMQVLLRLSGAGPDPVMCTSPYDNWPYFLIMHLGGALRVRAHEAYLDSAALTEGMRRLQTLTTRAMAGGDRRAYAALIHTYGEGWLERAIRGRDVPALDSALSRLRFTLGLRAGLPANVSHVETRITLARALRLEARLRPALAKAQLIEAESTLTRGFVSGDIHNDGLDARLWLALADLAADRASFDRDTAQATQGFRRLAEATRLTATPLPPVRRAQFRLVAARLSGASWSLTHDERSGMLAVQNALDAREATSEDVSYVWALEAERGRLLISAAPPQPPGLDYPFPAFSPGLAWATAPLYPMDGPAVRVR